MSAIEQPKPLKRAWKSSVAIIGWVVLFAAGVNLLYLAPSLFMMQVYDRVLATGSVTTLLLLALALGVALITLVFLDAMRMRLLARISFRLDKILAPALLDASLRRQGKANDVRARQSLRDFDTFRQVITGPPAVAIADAPWSLIFIAVCFLLHPWIGFLVTGGGLVLITIAMRNEASLRRSIDAVNERAPRHYASQEAELTHGELVRALGMRRALVARQLARRDDINALQAHTIFGAAYYAAGTKLTRLVLQSAALGLGAYLAIEGQITPGALIASSILSTRALAPIEQIVSSWRHIRTARSAYASIETLLRDTPEEEAKLALPAPRGRLELDRVGLRLGGGERWAVYDASLRLSPGEVVGVIGPSGAGKSSLARIAATALMADYGQVRIDDAAIGEWNGDELGSHIGYLPQEVGLLAGSVAENIARFTPVAGEAAVERAIVAAAKEAGIHEMISRLPGGYNFVLGPGGRGLSMGQAQRVGLARALYGDPTLLVLDEPNANLDSEGEAALVSALRRAKERNAAVLIVAHRPGVLAVVDRLVLMRDGRIEAVGPRDEITQRISSAASANSGLIARAREAQA